ncbi:hypothetical protein QP166_04425 [Sphingomonas sp. LR60]|uniref:hypothetical protein n=1 Tax=Sphingomonas sp. LR60 TaxID=3050233 RepID=UPI002FE324D3
MDDATYAAWMRAGLDTWMLGAEAANVMALRCARIATGGAAGRAETELMVTEKLRAAVELQTRLMTGALGLTPLTIVQGTTQHYRRKVAANSKRLIR